MGYPLRQLRFGELVDGTDESELAAIHKEKVEALMVYDPKRKAHVASGFCSFHLAGFDLDEKSNAPLGPPYQPDPSLPRKWLTEYDTANECFEKADSAINVVSLRVVRAGPDHTYPVEVYGKVIARDEVDHKCVYLFDRERKDAQLINSEKDMLALTGPNRALVTLGWMYFEFDLKIKGKDEHGAEVQFSKGVIPYYYNPFDMRIISQLPSFQSTVKLVLQRVSLPVAASIEVNVVNEGHDDTILDYNGKITAGISRNYRQHMVLYDTSVPTGSLVRGNGSLVLNRNLVAVKGYVEDPALKEDEKLVVYVCFLDPGCEIEDEDEKSPEQEDDNDDDDEEEEEEGEGEGEGEEEEGEGEEEEEEEEEDPEELLAASGDEEEENPEEVDNEAHEDPKESEMEVPKEKGKEVKVEVADEEKKNEQAEKSKVEEVKKATVGAVKEEKGALGQAEAHIFLQMVVAFSLKDKFDQEFLRSLFFANRRRKELAKFACILGFEESVADAVQELITSGNVIEAIYIAHEAGLLERFPPVPLLNSYIKDSTEKAQAVLSSGRRSSSAVDEAKSLECTACKSVIRCVEACHLLSVFNIDNIKRKVARIEKEKSDRKKLGGNANRFQNKRSRGAAMHQSFPAAKSARGSGSGYGPSFQNPVSRSFGYAARSAGAVAQAYYAPGSMAARRGGVLYGGPGAAFGQQPYHR